MTDSRGEPNQEPGQAGNNQSGQPAEPARPENAANQAESSAEKIETPEISPQSADGIVLIGGYQLGGGQHAAGEKPPEMPPPPPGQKKGPNLPPHLASMVEKTQKVARTALDYLAVEEVVKRTTKEQEIKMTELLLEKANEPVAPFIAIENYKMAAACPLKWEGMTGEGRVRFCERCRLQVYDFDSMQLPEAQELIAKREDKRDYVLHKRKDGKFMTSDCPAGVANRRNLIAASVGGILLVISLLWLASQAPPPKPATTANPQSEQPSAAGKSAEQTDENENGTVTIIPKRQRGAENINQPASNTEYTGQPAAGQPPGGQIGVQPAPVQSTVNPAATGQMPVAAPTPGQPGQAQQPDGQTPPTQASPAQAPPVQPTNQTAAPLAQPTTNVPAPTATPSTSAPAAPQAQPAPAEQPAPPADQPAGNPYVKNYR